MEIITWPEIYETDKEAKEKLEYFQQHYLYPNGKPMYENYQIVGGRFKIRETIQRWEQKVIKDREEVYKSYASAQQKINEIKKREHAPSGEKRSFEIIEVCQITAQVVKQNNNTMRRVDDELER